MPATSKAFRITTTVNNNTIFHAMCMSNWAYTRGNHSKDGDIASRLRMNAPTFFTLTGSNAPQFFIVGSPLGIQIAIAGTTTLAQWMDYITQAGVTNATGLTGKTFGPFDDWSNRITDVIRANIAINLPLFFTGHSLGGAMAILVAEKLRGHGFLNSIVYTFGCPRVGDRDFTNEYESVVHNYRNQGDAVPSLPPAALAYVRFLPSGRQVLPYLSRPGFDYCVPQGPRPWLNPSTLVEMAVPGLWAARIPDRTVSEHLEFTYLRSAWRLGTQRERFDASDWYGVCNGIWGVGLSPAP